MQVTVIAYFLLICGFFYAPTVAFNNLEELLLHKNEEDVNANLNTLELIRKAGYPAEAHVVLTEDDYFLTIHRIPGSKKSKPVFLQHGIFGSSADWVTTGKEKALAFILANQGYDVWLGNFRGNAYSRAHISKSTSDPQFWDFSFDEMGTYDLPAMISYITSQTLEPLHTYIGYSMGSTSFYIMATKRPEIAKTVKMMISFAPVAFLGNMTIPFRFLLPFADSIKAILHVTDVDKIITDDSVLKYLVKLACNLSPLQKEICSEALFLVGGFNEEQFNYTLLPELLGHFPSSTSPKTLYHYMQLVKSSKFCAYDYGKEKNMQIYNAIVPPDYDLSRIKNPIALFHGDSDYFVNEKDLNILRGLLKNIVDDYRVPLHKCYHLDFMWAKDAPTLIYERALKIMKKEIN